MFGVEVLCMQYLCRTVSELAKVHSLAEILEVIGNILAISIWQIL